MSQPSPYQPPRAPKPKMSTRRKVAFWVGGVFAAFVLIGAIGDATGAGKKADAGDSANSQTIVVVDTASSSAAHSPSPAAVKASSPAAAPHTSAAAVKTAVKPKPSPSCTLPDNRDLLVWYKAPGIEDSAQEIGEVDVANCTPAVDFIMSTSPTGPGYCTEVAYADQNPGYNPDATPAKPLKHVLQETGGGC